MIDKKIMQRHFSRNAVHYDTYAMVQRQMAEELIALLAQAGAELGTDKSILDAGCGTGGMLRHLIRYFPASRILAVDIAPGMIAAARGKFSASQVGFICGDIETMDLARQFDLIVSNAAFQWFNDPGATLRKLYRCLNPGGRIAFATFGPATFQELHQSFQLAQCHLGIRTETLPGQRFLSCAQWRTLCREHIGSEADESYGFTSREDLVVHLFNSVRDFLQTVKKAGANNSNQVRGGHPALTREMMRIYTERFRVEGKIVATYHCVYIVLQKGGVKMKKENVSIFSSRGLCERTQCSHGS